VSWPGLSEDDGGGWYVGDMDVRRFFDGLDGKRVRVTVTVLTGGEGEG
jgi:hypothetical protein